MTKGDIPSIPDRSTPSSGNCSAQNHVLHCRCILEGCDDSVSSSCSDTWPFHSQPESSLPKERSIPVVGASYARVLFSAARPVCNFTLRAYLFSAFRSGICGDCSSSARGLKYGDAVQAQYTRVFEKGAAFLDEGS